MTATQMLYAAAGNPAVSNVEKLNGHCWLCGTEISEGVDKNIAIKDTFMDIDKAASPDSTHWCAACTWSFSEQLQFPGYEKPQRMRTYSHFVVDGKWLRFTKANKDKMREILFSPPQGEWLAVISDSGQKHIIFRAAPSFGNDCRVQFEERQISFKSDSLRETYEKIDALYQGGFSKGEIESGNYSSNRIMKFGLSKFQALEREIISLRGSALFELAVFLTTKKGESEDGAAD